MVYNYDEIVYYEPAIVITTSLRTSPLTNTLIKTLSRLLNAPIIRRGSSNLDEIAYYAASEGYQGFIVVYTRLGNPSVLTLYHLTKEGFFELYGRVFLLGIHINRRFKKAFDGLGLTKNCESKYCDEIYLFFKDYLSDWKTSSSFNKNYVYMVVKDLEEFREKWIKNDEKNKKFAPTELDFLDPNKFVSILRIKVHHVWRYKQE